jgi:hypothetical protein
VAWQIIDHRMGGSTGAMRVGTAAGVGQKFQNGRTARPAIPTLLDSRNARLSICLIWSFMRLPFSTLRAGTSYDPQAHYFLGVPLVQRNRFPEAKTQLEHARDLNPDLWGTYFYIGKLFGRWTAESSGETPTTLPEKSAVQEGHKRDRKIVGAFGNHWGREL